MKTEEEILPTGKDLLSIEDAALTKHLLEHEVERLSELLHETEQKLLVSHKEIRHQAAERLKLSAELLLINKERTAQAEIDLQHLADLTTSKETVELQRDKIMYMTVLAAKNLESKMLELKYYHVLDNIGFAILIHQDGSIVYSNRIAIEVFKGSQANDLQGNPISSRFHKDYQQVLQQRFTELVEKALFSSAIDVKCIRLNGEIFEAEVQNSFTIYKDKPAIITQLIETTARKLRRKAIADKSEDVHKLIVARDKFFAIIAHDLRGPLGGFMALAEVLADSTYELPEEEKRQMIAEMVVSSRNTFNLLESLLEWAKMDLNLVDFNPSVLNVQYLCLNTYSILEESVKAKSLEFKIDIPEDIMVYADPDMLQSIFRNLISNAIKFTHDNGCVSLYCKQVNSNKIEIFVEDTGIGMSNKICENLFDLTSKVKRLGTNGEKSTGLGIHLCKQFIEKNGGEFNVKSIENQGSIFSFTLPKAHSKLKQ